MDLLNVIKCLVVIEDKTKFVIFELSKTLDFFTIFSIDIRERKQSTDICEICASKMSRRLWYKFYKKYGKMFLKLIGSCQNRAYIYRKQRMYTYQRCDGYRGLKLPRNFMKDE